MTKYIVSYIYNSKTHNLTYETYYLAMIKMIQLESVKIKPSLSVKD